MAFVIRSTAGGIIHHSFGECQDTARHMVDHAGYMGRNCRELHASATGGGHQQCEQRANYIHPEQPNSGCLHVRPGAHFAPNPEGYLFGLPNWLLTVPQ